MLKEWVLPTTSSEKSLLEAQFTNIEYPPGGSPQQFYARIDSVLNKLKLVGVTKTEQQIIDVLMDRLPDRFRMEKVVLRAHPHLTRKFVESTIGDAYAAQRKEEILKSSTQSAAPVAQAAPQDPHALFVGGFQSVRGGVDGGGGGRCGCSHRTHRSFGFG